jgi:hypothetical protein
MIILSPSVAVSFFALVATRAPTVPPRSIQVLRNQERPIPLSANCLEGGKEIPGRRGAKDYMLTSCAISVWIEVYVPHLSPVIRESNFIASIKKAA